MQNETTILYGGGVSLEFNPKKHHYTVNGETIDGVTSILGVINKPALIYWSANKAAEYVDKFLPVNTAIDEVQKLNLVNGCKTAHRTLKEAAGDVGTLCHNFIHEYISGNKPEMPKNEMLLKMIEQFLAWVKEKDVVFKWSERKIYSQKYKYAGTLDFTATIKGKNVLGDIKTSSGIYDEYWLQTAAYCQALQEEFPEQKIDHTVIIRCGKDGTFEASEMNDFEKNMEAFAGALALYRRLKEMKFNNLTQK